MKRRILSPVILGILMLCGTACQPERPKQAAQLYKTHCASCHQLPQITDLPRDIWAQAILPDMAVRMGLRPEGYNPFAGLSYEEFEAVVKTGIYPQTPVISLDDWNTLEAYVLEMAPDSLPLPASSAAPPLQGFKAVPVDIDSVPGSLLTYLDYDTDQDRLLIGDMSGALRSYEHQTRQSALLDRVNSPVIGYSRYREKEYITAVGKLDPSQIPAGYLFGKEEGAPQALIGPLHRPVHSLVQDLNGDGRAEIVICEFGDLVGSLNLFYQDNSGNYQKQQLYALPGSTRVVARDMNADGKTDLIVLTAQGQEAVTIYYQQEGLSFRAERVLEFSPVWGSSWFDLADFNGDGQIDIVTAHGDNADKSYVHKPYHGLRIHLNSGENNFRESHFIPMNGATRVEARDYDQDGDVDLAAIATFPNYDQLPPASFRYFENQGTAALDFEPYGLDSGLQGRWFLLTSSDMDGDGDIDIALSNFTYPFTPVPEELQELWEMNATDVLILENNAVTTQDVQTTE